MRLRETASAEDIVRLVEEVGFLPFFACGIEGFSVEECCPPELWFSDEREGPWEWKGPVARTRSCMYGKLFNGKAGFVSKRYLPDLANYRRDGYDFDSRSDEGLCSRRDAYVFNTVQENGKLLSKRLKQLCNFKKGANTGFETIITRLQMQTYVCIADFVYERDKHGKPYGWGVAEYTTPEALFGYECLSSAYKKDPLRSREDMICFLRSVLPDIPSERLLSLLKIRKDGGEGNV